jgi:two-component system invasion response regulator UvrY
MTKKFLFVDDHAVVRASFTKILSQPFQPVEVEEAANGDEAMAKVRKGNFDLVIMDVQMPQTNTVGLVEFIVNHSPSTKILMLSMAPEKVHARHYLKAGASGYISKQATLDEVTVAIDLILRGKKYISDSLADYIVKDSFEKKEKSNPFNKLSSRELEIVTLLLEGKSLTDISGILNISTSTIGTHKSRLMEKLNAANLIELKDIAAVHNV